MRKWWCHHDDDWGFIQSEQCALHQYWLVTDLPLKETYKALFCWVEQKLSSLYSYKNSSFCPAAYLHGIHLSAGDGYHDCTHLSWKFVFSLFLIILLHFHLFTMTLPAASLTPNMLFNYPIMRITPPNYKRIIYLLLNISNNIRNNYIWIEFFQFHCLLCSLSTTASWVCTVYWVCCTCLSSLASQKSILISRLGTTCFPCPLLLYLIQTILPYFW